MKDKYGYIIVSIVLFVEILALMIFISCGGDMCRKILFVLVTIIVAIIALIILFFTLKKIIFIYYYFFSCGDSVYLSKDKLNCRCNFNNAKEIYIAKDVTNIPYKHFFGLKKLQYVEFEGENTIISENAFEGCKKLERVYLPSKLTKIKNETFKGCSSLEDIIIPDSLTYISDSAFVGCNKIKYNKCNKALYIGNKNDLYVALIKVEDKNITSCEIDIITKIIASSAFKNCEKLEEIIIPNSVKTISKEAFAGCKSLKSVIIGKGVISIEEYAFYDCTNLTNVTFADTNNWYYTDKNGYTGEKKVDDISDSKKNAENLKNTLCDKYWYKQ